MNIKKLFLLVVFAMISSLSYAQIAPPDYHINQINSINSDGVADSLGVNVSIRGIVHCIDFRAGTGLEFYLAEYNNTGIKVFDFADVSGYTVTEGDSLEVWGTIGQFNGHLQLNPDSIIVHSTGNSLVMPIPVTQLSESTENKFISFGNAWLVDTMQWTNSGSGFNVDITNGTDTILMRIDNATNLYGQPRPAEPFNISGWAGQYDTSIPYDEGYQLFPCGLSSITVVPSLFPPYYHISQVNSIDANGVADSLGAMVRIRGVVHCIDFRAGTGLEFYLAEYNNTGIKVFDFADVNGYTVTEGDSLEILGTISQFNGNLQLDPDSIIVHSTGNSLVMPMTVTQLSEMTENKFVSFDNAWLVDTMQWTNSGSGFNVDITNGTDTILMRIDNATNLYGQPKPTGSFAITGWAGQYDTSTPYDEGYQLFPCGIASVTPTPVDVSVVSFWNLDSTYCNVATISGSIIINNMTPNDASNVPYSITANGTPLAAGTIPSLAGNSSDTITVGPFPAATGVVNILATTVLSGDNDTANDSLSTIVFISNTTAAANIATPISCNGDSTGQIIAVGINGLGTYNYTWTSNTGNALTATVPNLPAGTYSVTLTDSIGCTDSATIILAEPTAITLSSSLVNVLCKGDSTGTITVSPLGGTPGYSFLWSNGETLATITGLPVGSYTATVTDANGCTDTIAPSITEPLTALTVNTVDNGNGTAVAIGAGGISPYSFLWDAAANNQATDTATALVHNGSYSVTITDANGCTDTASVVINIVGINNPTSFSNLNLYPNPTSNNVFVKLELKEQATVEINIMNTLGQLVLNKRLGMTPNELINLNTSNLLPGTYTIHFKINQKHITRKLIIK